MKTLVAIFLIVFGTSAVAQLSWNDRPFMKVPENPIMGADSSYTFYCPMQQKTVKWQRADVFNPAAIIREGKVYMLFRAEDNPKAEIGGRTSRIGVAVSDDGIHFRKHDKPVLYPDKDGFTEFDYPGGCEDPRVIETESGIYVMAYTSWNGKTARLSIAFSEDLYKWEKKGPAFLNAYGGKYKDQWSKSGSIITAVKNGKPVAAKINGKYWMYWGEHFINLAWSDDMYNWTPLENEKGELKQLVTVRKGKFDSDLTECGPPAIVTDKGILLLYNGKNSNNDNASTELPRGTYSVGQIIFDPADPEVVRSRSSSPFLKPSLPHEVTGQYAAGTTFAEALIFFRGRWLLYYGTADSYVGLAVKD
jgi:beta-1,2-mannosidase